MIRVALIHDWLTGMRGGEAVFEAIAELFPKAEVFTLLAVPARISPGLAKFKRHTSWLQRIPGAAKKYRHFLPLMPSMIERFDLTGFDLIISSSHCVAKGIQKPPGAVHVTYIHAPMRYMWDRYDDYFGPGRSSFPVRWAAAALRKKLQGWDQRVSTPERIDAVLANSQFIAAQIQRIYRRSAQVIYPFADLTRFQLPRRKANQKYLMVTAFAPYKRIDLAIEAFNELKLPLLIIGEGQDADRLKKLAGPTVEFLGSLPGPDVTDLFLRCKALIFPGIEDFGITPLEAMAAGIPVIAYGEGGACESITEKTGLLFKPQTTEALVQAVRQLEQGKVSFREEDCRAQAAQFSREKFQNDFSAAVQKAWVGAKKDPREIGVGRVAKGAQRG